MRNIFFKLFFACAIVILSPLFMITPLNAICVYCVPATLGCGPCTVVSIADVRWGSRLGCGQVEIEQVRTCGNQCGTNECGRRTRPGPSLTTCRHGWGNWTPPDISCNITSRTNPDNFSGNCVRGGQVRRGGCHPGEVATHSFIGSDQITNQYGDVVIHSFGGVNCR